jgi:hypothetical protein
MAVKLLFKSLYTTPRFEGAEDAWRIISSGPEPLVSQFNVSYGLVLNLLSIYTLDQARNFCNKSFGAYLRVGAACGSRNAEHALCNGCSRCSNECLFHARFVYLCFSQADAFPKSLGCGTPPTWSAKVKGM